MSELNELIFLHRIWRLLLEECRLKEKEWQLTSARGQEAAQIVRAEADRKAVETVSEAKRKQIIRGTADALTTKIFADAFGRDPEFYAFTRSLIAYEQSMTSSNTTMVISPNSEFFDYIKESEKE